MATESQGSNGHGASSGASSFVHNLNFDDAQQMLDNSRVMVEEAVEKAGQFVRQRPLLCLAGAVAIGYLIGKIASR
jgi:ElaB/YqjD/DUF883 family membrane-anchored ribosome-binding protein